MATDEVRIEGLRAILDEVPGDGCGWELVLLSEPGALETAQLEVVLVDARATGHLLELLRNFRRLRPQVVLDCLLGRYNFLSCPWSESILDHAFADPLLFAGPISALFLVSWQPLGSNVHLTICCMAW